MLQNRPRFPNEQPATLSGFAAPQTPVAQQSRPRGLVLPWWLFNIAPLFLVIGLALELWGSPGLKPSIILGGALGSAESTKIKTELAAVQSNLAAQNEENARLQKQLAYYQAQVERVSEGYKTLYQRSTLMSQALSQAQEKFLEMQASIAKESQEGNLSGAQFGSMVAGLGLLLGDQKMAAGGMAASRAFTNEATTNINRQLQQSVQGSVAMTTTWQQGLPDTNTIDSIVAGTADNPAPPVDHAPPPPPPAIYQQQPPEQQASFSAASSAPQESTPFLEGAKDRHAWEGWFATLAGDSKAGANFWAEKRNDPRWRGRASCARGDGGAITDEFRGACEMAKTFFAKVDKRRTTEPDYKHGWNSL
jgi:hypothetical protein